jgi:hypothetical protein
MRSMVFAVGISGLQAGEDVNAQKDVEVAKARALAAVLLLSGCASTLDPNFAIQVEAYRQAINAQKDVEVAKARAEEARYIAMQQIALGANPTTQQFAVLALALGGRGDAAARPVEINLPRIPETQEDRALKWAAIFAGPTTAIASSWFGYRLGQTQSNNATAAAISANNSFATIATSGFNANQGIATAGFGAAQGIATTGFQTLPLFKPPTPNITVNGNGVIGSGSYVGDNSGANSGNTGLIRVGSPDCTSGNTGGATSPTGGAQC